MAVSVRDSEYPILQTSRLILRPYRLSDAPQVVQLAGSRAIADTTISIPHPYALEAALGWIERHRPDWLQRSAVRFALEERSLGMVGGIELRSVSSEHAEAELGFWIGQPFWGCRYAREAASAVVRFGFEELDLNRVRAHYMVRNPASGRVLAAVGFRQEGLLRQAVRKWGRFEDVIICGILRGELRAM